MDTKMFEQLASYVLPKEILKRFEIVKIETEERDIDSMSMTIHLEERMNRLYQESGKYESLGFMDAFSITHFPIRDHKVVLKIRRRRWKNKQTGERNRYSKELTHRSKMIRQYISKELISRLLLLCLSIK